MTQISDPATQQRRSTATLAATGPVVVAVGGSDAASALLALHVAQFLALESNAEALAVAVLEPLPVYATGSELTILPPEFESERRAELLEQLRGQVERIAGQAPNWHTRVIHGDPARAIADVARQEKAPLIVMGIGRHGPIDRLLGAETTVRTIRPSSRVPRPAAQGPSSSSSANRVLAGTCSRGW